MAGKVVSVGGVLLRYREYMQIHRGQAAAILLAGGRGRRARLQTNKAYLQVHGAPLVVHSLQTLDRCSWVAKVVLVIRPQDRHLAEQAMQSSGITTPWLLAEGGSSRHRSEHRGLAALADDIRDGVVDLVAIHDGARPFLTPDLLDGLFQSARRHGGAVPTLAVETPTFQMSETGDLQPCEEGRLHRAQTPQIFWAAQLWAAYQKARQAGFEGVDTAETVERFSSLKIKAIPGDRGNLKLTFPEDFERVRRRTR